MDETITVPVSTLKEWLLCLSQGDNSPRWEIEKLLTNSGYNTKN